jgi:hypothetical protein
VFGWLMGASAQDAVSECEFQDYAAYASRTMWHTSGVRAGTRGRSPEGPSRDPHEHRGHLMVKRDGDRPTNLGDCTPQNGSSALLLSRGDKAGRDGLDLCLEPVQLPAIRSERTRAGVVPEWKRRPPRTNTKPQQKCGRAHRILYLTDGPWRGGLPLEEGALRVSDLQFGHAIALAARR